MLVAHLKRILGLERLRLRGPCGASDEFLPVATAQTSTNWPRYSLYRCKLAKPDQKGARTRFAAPLSAPATRFFSTERAIVRLNRHRFPGGIFKSKQLKVAEIAATGTNIGALLLKFDNVRLLVASGRRSGIAIDATDANLPAMTA